MPVAPNTLEAHRLVLYASAQGLGKAMSSALYRAYFCRALDITDPAELERTAAIVGLESVSVHEFLSGIRFQNEVRDSQAQASRLGISGVPFYIFDQKYALSGAQPPAAFETALNRALEQTKTSL